LSETLKTISLPTALELIELGRVGLMTGETYMELMGLLGSVKIGKQSPYHSGSENLKQSASTTVQNLALSSTKSEE